MERDTQEWLRPWRAGDAVVGGRDHEGGGTERDAAGTTPTSTGPTVATAPRLAPPTRRPEDGPARGGIVARSEGPPRHAGHARPTRDGAGRPDSDSLRAAGARPSRLRAGVLGVGTGLIGAVVGTLVTLAVVDRDADDEAIVADPVASSSAESPSDSGSTEPSATPSSPVVESVPDDLRATVVSTVAEAVLPSVVRIDVFVTEDDPDLGAVDVAAGVGSGVAYGTEGHVLTNNHVVADADTVRVQLADGSTVAAEVVGTDRLTDLAVLRIEDTSLTPVTLRLDDPLQVGETAVAIGSPFGLDASVTAGVVSAVNRDLEVPGEGDEEPSFVIPGTIQTDAAINPGNSGGALVDANGRLIGINTAILTSTGGSQGVGFAIPTRSVVAAADQLIEDGVVSHPFLGIEGLDVTNEVALRYRDDYDIELDGGAVVSTVVEGSGAAEADLRPGDIVVSFDREPVRGMTDVIGAILAYDIGETVPVGILRDGERMTLRVTLGERPAEQS